MNKRKPAIAAKVWTMVDDGGSPVPCVTNGARADTLAEAGGSGFRVLPYMLVPRAEYSKLVAAQPGAQGKGE